MSPVTDFVARHNILIGVRQGDRTLLSNVSLSTEEETGKIFGTPSIYDQVLNTDYLPEIRKYFERLSAQEPFQEILHVTLILSAYSLFMYPTNHETANALY